MRHDSKDDLVTIILILILFAGVVSVGQIKSTVKPVVPIESIQLK